MDAVIVDDEIAGLHRSGVAHIDTPQDHAFFATMYKFAVEHRVKYILTGANYSTECIRNPLEWMYYQSDSRQLRELQDWVVYPRLLQASGIAATLAQNFGHTPLRCRYISTFDT